MTINQPQHTDELNPDTIDAMTIFDGYFIKGIEMTNKSELKTIAARSIMNSVWPDGNKISQSLLAVR